MTPATTGASGRSETKSPALPVDGQRRVAVEQAHVARAVRETRVTAGQIGHGQQQQVGDGVLEARAAKRANDGQRRRAAAESFAHGQLRVALVLGRRDERRTSAPPARSRSTSAGASESESPTTTSTSKTERFRLQRAAVGGNNKLRRRAARADGQPPSRGGHVAIGDDQGKVLQVGTEVTDSLRWYEPDQVSKGLRLSALSAPEWRSPVTCSSWSPFYVGSYVTLR